MFKLIAIEIERPVDYEIVQTDRYKSIHKIMSFKLDDYNKDDVSRVFYFHKGYTCHAMRTVRDAEEKGLDNHFFTKNGTQITFTALVGENGMGKSTLLELYIRLMNNCAYALRKGIDKGNSYNLLFVPDLYVTAYFEDVDGSFFAVQQFDNRITYLHQGIEETEWHYDYYEGEINVKASKADVLDAIGRLSALCYTVVVNYASYAYNTVDYIHEWDRRQEKDVRTNEERCWLSALFHKNDSYQTPLVLNPFREEGVVDYNNERSLTQERLFRLVLNERSPLSRILHRKDAKSIVLNLNYEYFPHQKRNHYDSGRVRWIMQQLMLIDYGKKYSRSEMTFIGDCIVNAWSRYIGFKLDGQVDAYWDPMLKERVCAINYIVYKTLKIIEIYPAYRSYKMELNACNRVHKSISDILRRAVLKMYKDYTHITLKLRRSLAFIMFKPYTSMQILGGDGKMYGHNIPIRDLVFAMHERMAHADEILELRIKESGAVKKQKYAEVHPFGWRFIDLMPAPFMHSDLILQDDDGAEVSFNSLSSGEKQIIHSISTILYQIDNIESAWRDTDRHQALYSKICLIFDEVELYFHPKYQTMLVGFLIDVLQGLHLNNIKDIHIILSTHSPFVLSDIPSSNTLRLCDGVQQPNGDKEMFGANVYDILNDNFFMPQFIGDFAAQKIVDIVGRVDRSCNEPKAIRDSLREEVALVGDTFIRNTLLVKLDRYDQN